MNQWTAPDTWNYELNNGFKNTITLPAPTFGLESFYVFSLAKAGSTLLNDIFLQLNAQLGIAEVDLPSHFVSCGIPALAQNPEKTIHGWGESPDFANFYLDKGYCYRGYRFLPGHMYPLCKAISSRSILLVRDPRDCLTSQYFSLRYSHQIAQGSAGSKMSTIRNRLAEMEVDEAVRTLAPLYRAQMNAYRTHLPHPALLFRYEDVIFNKSQLISTILDFLDRPLESSALESILNRVDVIPDKEKPSEHVRKVKPGDHKEKLQPETIKFLDTILAEELAFYGYNAS